MASPKDQYACARICVEVDLEAGFLEAIKLTVGNCSHFQKLDYEQLPFKCRGCHEYGHFIRNCPKNLEFQQDKAEGWHRVNRSKPKNQAGVAPKKGEGTKEVRVLPLEASQENSKTKETNEARDESNDAANKSSNGDSKESEVALSNHHVKEQDEGAAMIKEGETMGKSEEESNLKKKKKRKKGK